MIPLPNAEYYGDPNLGRSYIYQSLPTNLGHWEAAIVKYEAKVKEFNLDLKLSYPAQLSWNLSGYRKGLLEILAKNGLQTESGEEIEAVVTYFNGCLDGTEYLNDKIKRVFQSIIGYCYLYESLKNSLSYWQKAIAEYETDAQSITQTFYQQLMLDDGQLRKQLLTQLAEKGLQTKDSVKIEAIVTYFLTHFEKPHRCLPLINQEIKDTFKFLLKC